MGSVTALGISTYLTCRFRGNTGSYQRINEGSVTSGGFCPNNALVITTSKNEVYVFDVEAKQLGEWSQAPYTSFTQKFPGISRRGHWPVIFLRYVNLQLWSAVQEQMF